MTIVLMDAYGMSGVKRSMLHVAGHLAERHDVVVLSVVRSRTEPFFGFPAGVRVEVADDQRGSGLRGPRRWVRSILRRARGRLVDPTDRQARRTTLWTDLMLVSRLRRLRPGAVIGTRPSLNVLVAQLSRPGMAAIGQEHMHLGHRSPHQRAVVRRSYGRLDALVVLTEGDRRAYEDALAGAIRVVAIPNPLPELGGPRSDLSQPVVLAAGRLSARKGFDLLIRAFARLAPEAPEARLRICGRGRRRAQLERRIMRHGLSGRVQLLGRVSNMAEQYEQSSVFVLSSRAEGFPMVLIEAMSKGLPVVSFDCPTGPADIVDHGRTGLLVPPGDVAGLAAGMLELIRDERKRRRLGEAAAARSADYRIERIGSRWEELLAGLAEPRRARVACGP